MAKKDFSQNAPSESTGFLLWQVTNLWQRKMKKALEEYDLTHSQFVLLASIHWFSTESEPITQILLSNHTKIDPMTTSTVLRTLVEKGLVQRQEHASDTRAKTISLTETGQGIVKKAITTVERFDGQFFLSLKNSKTFNENLAGLLKAQSAMA
jgi:DNA-binding MarR family transcriptional regulator